VAAVAAVPAPTVVTQAHATVTPATVAAVASVPTPGLRPVNAQSAAVVTAGRTSLSSVTAGAASEFGVTKGALSSSSVTD
jgi:hypothetical protein